MYGNGIVVVVVVAVSAAIGLPAGVNGSKVRRFNLCAGMAAWIAFILVV